MTIADFLYKNGAPPSRPFLRISLYYTILIALGVGLDVILFNQFGLHLLQQPVPVPFGSETESLRNFWSTTGDYGLLTSSLDLLANLMMVMILMLPVSWVYMATRARTGIDQAVVQTMILLPIAVTGIVAMVRHSVALAFGLAGIVAAVRFRNTLKKTADALYIFTAIGVGLAAGSDNIGIALVLTMVFNYTVLMLWRWDFGYCPKAGPLPGYSSGKILKVIGKKGKAKQKKIDPANHPESLSESSPPDTA